MVMFVVIMVRTGPYKLKTCCSHSKFTINKKKTLNKKRTKIYFLLKKGKMKFYNLKKF